MFEEIVDRYINDTPVAVLFRATFGRVYSTETLDEIFREHKERQVDGELLFSTVVGVLAPVVYGAKASVNLSHKEREEEIGVSVTSVYNKLQGVEPQVSAALVNESVGELEALQRQARTLAEGPLPGYRTFILDGKRLDATEHRIKETRVLNSAPLPGALVTMYDTELELFVDAACDPDAYACERKIVEPLLERNLQKGCVYMGDRNFCDGPLIGRFVDAQAFYVLRQHGRSPKWRQVDGQEPRFIGADCKGGQVFERTIEVYLPGLGRWEEARQITVELVEPTRDGETSIRLLTNLPESVSAVAVAEAYLDRWTIERCLGHIAQSLNAEINTLAYPGAALLSFCLGLVLFNLIRTIEKLLLHYSPTPPGLSLSHYYLAHEILEVRRGMEVAIDSSYWERYARMSVTEYLAFVQKVARRTKLHKYKKNIRGPKQPPPERRSGKGKAHVSTHRLLAARHC